MMTMTIFEYTLCALKKSKKERKYIIRTAVCVCLRVCWYGKCIHWKSFDEKAATNNGLKIRNEIIIFFNRTYPSLFGFFASSFSIPFVMFYSGVYAECVHFNSIHFYSLCKFSYFRFGVFIFKKKKKNFSLFIYFCFSASFRSHFLLFFVALFLCYCRLRLFLSPAKILCFDMYASNSFVTFPFDRSSFMPFI